MKKNQMKEMKSEKNVIWAIPENSQNYLKVKCGKLQNKKYAKPLSEKKNLYFCHRCPVKKLLRENLIKHLQRKHGYVTQKNEMVLITKCMKCDEKVDITKLFLHYKNSHKTVPPGYKYFECDQCSSKLSSKASLIVHISTFHDDKNDP